jgi:hypothetical protein
MNDVKDFEKIDYILSNENLKKLVKSSKIPDPYSTNGQSLFRLKATVQKYKIQPNN